ncbi:MAG TPA: hypothetical protein VI455_14245 [Terriglobia bacterium]
MKPSIVVHPIPVGTSATRLRLVLPESMPPGAYRGTVQVGDSRYPILAEVEAYPHLRLSPTRLSLEAAASSEVEVELTVVNGGNVICEVGRAYALGLFDKDGLNRGTAAAFQEDSPRGQERVGRLMDEFAEGYGGFLRMKVEEGAGPLEPGQLRNLRLKLKMPDRLKAGRSYFGTWSFHNLAYQVTVRAMGREAGEVQ